MHSRTDDDFMQLAIDQAKIALTNELLPVGVIFAKDDHRIAHGRKTGEAHFRLDHAEYHACRSALSNRNGPRSLRGVTVYSTLEPCVMCMGMLLSMRVSRIVYAIPDPHGGGSYLLRAPRRIRPERFKEDLPKLEQASGKATASAAELFRQFFKQTRSTFWQDPDNALVKLVTQMD